MKLKLNGKPFDPTKQPTASEASIISYLTGAPGEVFDGAELRARLSIGKRSLESFAANTKYSAYRHKTTRNYYGHPEAIKEFKRLLAEQR